MLRALSIILAVSLLASACPTEAEPLPVELFAREAAYQSLRLSPDGSHLATLVRQGDNNALIVINREEMAVTGSVRVDLNQHIGQYFWASEDRVAAKILSLDSASDRLLDYGEIFAMDADGSAKKLLFGYRVGDMQTGSRIKRAQADEAHGSILDPLPEDDKHILIVSYPFSGTGESTPSVYRLNIHRGTKTSVTRTPLINGDVLGDPEGFLWAASNADLEGRVEVMWRDKDNADWMPLVKADDLTDRFSAVGFDAEKRTVLALSNMNTATIALVAVSLDTGDETVLLSDDRYDAAWTIYDADQRTVLGVCYHADRPRCDYLDPSHRVSKLHASLQAAFPGQHVTIVSWSADRSEAILWVWGDRSPGDYFAMDTGSNKVDFLFSSRDWIDPNAMASKSPVRFDARDGTSIEGYLTRPLGADGPTPMVVLVHGGPHGPRDTWSYDPEVQLLANRGYSVLQVNFRGSGGYGRAFQSAGYQRWGTTIQDDITDGTRWAIDQGYAVPEKICIYGSSFGGYSALMSAAREPELYACAIGNVGVYDMAEMFESGDIPDSRGGPEYLSMVLSTDSALHREQSPVFHVDKIKAKLMIAYGKRDERAPPIQSTRLTDALDGAEKDYELVVSRRAAHGIADPEIRAEYYSKLVEFLGQSLGG